MYWMLYFLPLRINCIKYLNINQSTEFSYCWHFNVKVIIYIYNAWWKKSKRLISSPSPSTLFSFWPLGGALTPHMTLHPDPFFFCTCSTFPGETQSATKPGSCTVKRQLVLQCLYSVHHFNGVTLLNSERQGCCWRAVKSCEEQEVPDLQRRAFSGSCAELFIVMTRK